MRMRLLPGEFWFYLRSSASICGQFFSPKNEIGRRWTQMNADKTN
jgi:hypothetical protein